MNWKNAFAPVGTALGLQSRPQQDRMGQAVCDSLTNRTNLIVEAATGTGKSLAALVPAITYVLAARPKQRRIVVATATKNLQDQYLRDLQRLSDVYNGAFSFRSLKGRNNYVCLNEMKMNARGTPGVVEILRELERKWSSLGDGERADAERVLGRELSETEWRNIGGSPIRCAERKCAEDECFSTRARNLAARADVVITNTAILRVDADTRDGAGFSSDAFLGDVDVVIVDEAHELEAALIDGWTEELNHWEIMRYTANISKGMIDAAPIVPDRTILERRTVEALEGVEKFLDSAIRFFLEYKDEPWNHVSETLCPKTVMAGSGAALIRAMEEFENDGPLRVKQASAVLDEVVIYLERVLKEMRDQGRGGTRKISVARTSAINLRDLLRKIELSMQSRNGVIMWYGIPYTVLISGATSKNGSPMAKITTVPMDISSKASLIWKDRISILMSATLRDLTDNSFRYVKESLGFHADTELKLDTVFDLRNRQISYITQGKGEVVDVPGAQYSREELINLINAARGRTLVLFTARRELDEAAEYLLNSGEIKYKILVQTLDANKEKLAEEFRHDTHSVLLATKSFFQGVDMPSETLSLVVLVKYPLPQYNELCKNQIQWWRGRGFPNWYESKSMEVFQQAAGRVIRTETDFGVVALIDQRVASQNNISKTAVKAVRSLGSPVVRSVEDVAKFLSPSVRN